MQIGLIGLGKMGFNLAINFKNKGYDVIAFDVSKAAMERLQAEGIRTVSCISHLAQALTEDRKLIWIMVPAGHAIDVILGNLKNHLRADDILIDGGNSNYKDTITRAMDLEDSGIHLLDCGTSGGVQGALHGINATIGGNKEAFDYCEPVFQSIAEQGGYIYCGKSGSGHFAKMVHNGIEYGMMQAIGEGLEILHRYDPKMDLATMTNLWNHGSGIRSWMMELTQQALEKDKNLNSIKGVMHSTGEAKWAVETALEFGIPAPVISMALMMRQRSQLEDTFSGKIVAALRNEFGGHAVEKQEVVVVKNGVS